MYIAIMIMCSVLIITVTVCACIDRAHTQTTQTPTPTPTQAHTWQAPAGHPDPLFSDMLHQVHLLIAGTTGSGKSVVISNILRAAMYSTPDQIQLILIDPKKVELIQYADLPHVLRYASEPDAMAQALQMGLDIVNRRYDAMQAQGIRKYPGAHVYIIIDEFADLILTNKAVKPILQRILQIGRAANVHCIAATQYVYAKIIDSTLKCLFDSRVALRTKTKLESRLIMDRSGLETLPRHGKAWYINPDADKLIDIPFLPDETIEMAIDYWKRQA